jgi:prepilin-type N-terminal cleavage/methylation domain-containing protein
MEQRSRNQGFTLIELSIVLVVIGLIVGGILVGQSLISAAGVRATISQIEKYNTAANTFREKYGYLPGDIMAGPAAQFGFAARGTNPGQGDGDGILQGWSSVACGDCTSDGELGLFWVDLSTAHLIDGGFNTATAAIPPGYVSGAAINLYFPQAKMGQGNYIFMSSGGSWNGSAWINTGVNYFNIADVTQIESFAPVETTPGLTVKDAYSIDSKVDDGLPQTGRVTAQYQNYAISACCGRAAVWAAAMPNQGTSNTGHTTGSPTTCYDNGNIDGATQQYSVEISNGANVNCALSFRMQAGD